MRFLFRTAFECRFCYNKIVSLHAACIELDSFAVAFTGPSGVEKSTQRHGVKRSAAIALLYALKKREARPVVFRGTKNGFSAM